MRRKAFTLVELLVVISIIALLATIVLPMANKARIRAQRTTLRSDLQALANAIEAYRNDFGDIPRPDGKVAGPFQGGAILTWTLLAPGPAVYQSPPGPVSAKGFKGDGADGIGFRVRGTTGTVHGPYLADGPFRFGYLTDTTNSIRVVPPTNPIYDNSATFIGDRAGNAILYFPRKSKIIITSVDTYLGALRATPTGPAFVANDNDSGLAVFGPGHPLAGIGVTGAGNPWAIQQFQLQLPGVQIDTNGKPSLPNPLAATTLPYLLWGTGPDGVFCSEDDVTNFKD